MIPGNQPPSSDLWIAKKRCKTPYQRNIGSKSSLVHAAGSFLDITHVQRLWPNLPRSSLYPADRFVDNDTATEPAGVGTGFENGISDQVFFGVFSNILQRT